MIYIYPYKLASESARALRDGLSSILGYRVKLVKPDGRFNPRRTDYVINWGSTTPTKWEWASKDINHITAIRVASNKLNSFEAFKLHNVPTPDWTTDYEEAKGWFTKKDTRVLCRSILNGHSGRGIHIASSADELTRVPLYVKYKKKRHEYRAHVIHGKVIDVQVKRKRIGFKDNDEANTFIRNHHTGWVYCRSDLPDTTELSDIAIKAVQALGLDFGAVDIIFNELENKYYVLEVNTAPGIDGTTINKYAQELSK